MTGAAPARRLLVRLIDEHAIETEPIAEVRADLAALGLDPARSIAFSRRLAAQANGPAVALLRQISESEADEDEIRRLETADIGAVRRSLPEAMTAVATASARRAAGSVSNIVGLRRRRSRRLLYGLSGVAAAMAASLVFYVGLSTDQPFRLEQAREAPEAAVASRPAAPAAELNDDSRLERVEGLTRPPVPEADAAKTESSELAQQQFSGGSIQAANEPAASGTQSAASPTSGADEEYREALPLRRDEQASADAAEAQRQREIAVEELEKSAAVARQHAELAEQPKQPADVAAGAHGAATASPPPAALPPPEMRIIPEHKPDLGPSVDVVAGATDPAATARAKEEESVQSVAVDTAAPTPPPTAPFGLTHPVVALLIVDLGSAPPGLRQEDYPAGNLPARLGEARRLAEGRVIAALVTLRMGDRTIDAIVSESPGKALSQAAAAPDAASATLGPVAPGYALIEIDGR